MNFVIVFLNALLYPIKLLLILLIKLYKWTISPLIPHTCRFHPTCSTYMIDAIHQWGIFKGVVIGVKRIARCRPKGKSGEDFVPHNIKGDLKWIY